MHKNENKKTEHLKQQIQELDLKIDAENDKLKHNNLIKEEMDNINASYNRCLQILARSARGKAANRKYNELYTINKHQHINTIDELDKQVQESKQKLDLYYSSRDSIEEEYEEEREKEQDKSKKETSN